VDRAVTFLGVTENALSLAEKEVERRSNVLATFEELRRLVAELAGLVTKIAACHPWIENANAV
jgi:hypothetical protein